MSDNSPPQTNPDGFHRFLECTKSYMYTLTCNMVDLACIVWPSTHSSNLHHTMFVNTHLNANLSCDDGVITPSPPRHLQLPQPTVVGKSFMSEEFLLVDLFTFFVDLFVEIGNLLNRHIANLADFILAETSDDHGSFFKECPNTSKHASPKWCIKQEREGETDNPGPLDESDDETPPASTDDESDDEVKNYSESEDGSGTEDGVCLEMLKKRWERAIVVANAMKKTRDIVKHVSANTHALMPRNNSIAAWKVEVTLLQEARPIELQHIKAKCKMREQGWDTTLGKPSNPAQRVEEEFPRSVPPEEEFP